MIISRTHGVAFIHIPRTGGESVRRSLRDRWDDADGHWPVMGGLGSIWTRHATAAHAMGDVPGWSELHSFCFVRNPWERMVSVWKRFGGVVDFDVFFDKPGTFGFNIRPQTQWIMDENGRQLVREVCRFETFERDFCRLSQRWGSSLPPPHLNASDHEPYREYYTPALRDKVADLFAADIAAFGYQWRG